jgi:hypothetical protein
MAIDTRLAAGQAALLARTYGVASARATGVVAKITPAATPAPAAPAPSVKTPSKAQNLVGAVVPGKVDFSTDTPRPAAPGASMPFYRRPTDRMEAATALSVGRTLDVTG